MYMCLTSFLIFFLYILYIYILYFVILALIVWLRDVFLSFTVKVEQLNKPDLRFGSVSEPKNSSILMHPEGV